MSYFNPEIVLSPAGFEMMEKDHTFADKTNCQDGRLIALTYSKDLDKIGSTFPRPSLNKVKGSKQLFFLYHAIRGCHTHSDNGLANPKCVPINCILEMDYTLDRLLKKLEETGELENTNPAQLQTTARSARRAQTDPNGLRCWSRDSRCIR